MTENVSYKAHDFAAFAEANNWDVETRRITHRDYTDKKFRQAGRLDRHREAWRGGRHSDVDRRGCNRAYRLALDDVGTKTDTQPGERPADH